MNDELRKKITKITNRMIFLSIIGLIFISFFPWISVEETSPVEDELYFNFDMMKKSYDDNIINLAEKINLINNLFILILILSVLSYIGLTISKIRNYNFISKLTIFIIGIGTLSLTSVIIYLIINFITTVENYEGMSSAYSIPFIKYVHFILLIGLLFLLCSISYTWRITSYFYKAHKEKSKIKNNLKFRTKTEITTKKNKEKEDIILPKTEKKVVLTASPIENKTLKNEQIEDWLKDEFKNMGNKPEDEIKDEQKEEIKKDLNKQDEQVEKTDETSIKEEKISKEEEKVEHSVETKNKENISDISEDKKIQSDENFSELYEKALSSAISKKQKEIKQRKKENQYEEEKSKNKNFDNTPSVDASEQYKNESEKKSINVYCPNCGNVFMVEKIGFTVNARCPRCGKNITL